MRLPVHLAVGAAIVTGVLASAVPATAQTFVNPTSYNMPNGFSGSFNYWMRVTTAPAIRRWMARRSPAVWAT
jgi:hypothetical protein